MKKARPTVSTGAPWYVPRGQVLLVRPDLADALKKLDGKSPREIFAERRAMADGGFDWQPVEAQADPEKLGKTALVSLIGPITQYEGVCDWMFGGTSLEAFMRGIEAAAADGETSSILMYIDSGGGDGAGIADAADRIREIGATMPIVAFVAGDGCSAAYWLASAASEIIISQTAITGSIGVKIGYDDDTKADEMAGIKHLEFVSSISPKKTLDPKTNEGALELQTIVDDFADIFVSSVADFRGVALEKVLTDFGQGGVFVGAKAVTAGLADRVGTLADAIGACQELAGAASDSTTGTQVPPIARATAEQGAPLMKTAQELLAEHPEAAAQIAASAGQAERERVSAILKWNTPQYRSFAAKEIDAAIADPSISADKLAGTILALHADGLAKVGAQRAADGAEMPPVDVPVGAPAPTTETTTQAEAAAAVTKFPDAKNVYADFNKQAGAGCNR